MSAPERDDAAPVQPARPAPAVSPGRRGLLLGLGAGAGAAVAAGFAGAALQSHADQRQTTPQQQPFFGVHQAGIVTPQPSAALVVAFDVLASTKPALERLLRLLTARITFLTQGGPIAQIDPRFPPPDSGILGPTIAPDNLTITVSLGASVFDARFGLAALKPRFLTEMPRFPNDQLDDSQCHGDLLLQICSNTAETNIHALRDIVKQTPDLLAVRWKIDGFLPPRTDLKIGRDTSRNLLGFKDGTANVDARDTALMDQLVWVGPTHREPEWAAGGSYQVVRVIRNLVEQWDRTPLREQQTIIGREKDSGAPLGMQHERDVPDYAATAQGATIPITAHIRLANPRTPDTQGSLILRRPFNYSRGITAAGQFDMGLLFIAYQADLAAGFITVQNRLNGEALEEYIKPIGGGYFFALPGVPREGDFLARALIAA